jgi:hypothetical protein
MANASAQLTLDQVAAMSPQDRAVYIAKLPPDQQIAVQQALQAKDQQAKRASIRNSISNYAYMPVAGGTGVTANYNAGSTLVFDFPVKGNGYCTDLLITYNLTVTLASGTAATYTKNAAAPWSIFSEMRIDFNGQQGRVVPYFLKELDIVQGYLRGPQNSVVAGNADATINAQLVDSTPMTIGVANSWVGKIRYRLNALGPDTIPGILPIMGVGSQPQLKITCTPQFLGYDPLTNVVSVNTGTGHAVTVTGTVSVNMKYFDGSNFSSPTPNDFNLVGEPTLQYFIDTPLNPLNANILQRQRINTLMEHWYVCSILIDGRQSNQFATWNNVNQFQFSPDLVGQHSFMAFNVANNIPIWEWFFDRRDQWGQDLDPGVFMWIAANSAGVPAPSLRNGSHALNMRSGGYPAASHAYQVNAVNSANITPRVETFLVSMNPDGLRIR